MAAGWSHSRIAKFFLAAFFLFVNYGHGLIGIMVCEMRVIRIQLVTDSFRVHLKSQYVLMTLKHDSAACVKC